MASESRLVSDGAPFINGVDLSTIVARLLIPAKDICRIIASVLMSEGNAMLKKSPPAVGTLEFKASRGGFPHCHIFPLSVNPIGKAIRKEMEFAV